ncbi:MAG: YchJ family protein [Proteobacteria bacterium]|nr:YchJ family protein [Pseudomonadota bacterium]
MACICGLKPSTEECCGRFLKGEARPETAEALMRSRYTAYVNADIDYIMGTHDPTTVHTQERSYAEKWAKEAAWDGLEIVSTEKGGLTDTEGVVEFKARYRINNQPAVHHERSSFRKDGDTWYYVDGDLVKTQTVRREHPKVGRNDPCPCGSGAKYKKCCGKAA